MSKLVVGQTLYQPPSQLSSRWAEYTVLKIGRTWATLSRNKRCTLDTLRLDRGGYSPIQLYVSREALEAEQVLNATWRIFVRSIDRPRAPAGVTLETIAQARALLKVSP